MHSVRIISAWGKHASHSQDIFVGKCSEIGLIKWSWHTTCNTTEVCYACNPQKGPVLNDTRCTQWHDLLQNKDWSLHLFACLARWCRFYALEYRDITPKKHYSLSLRQWHSFFLSWWQNCRVLSEENVQVASSMWRCAKCNIGCAFACESLLNDGCFKSRKTQWENKNIEMMLTLVDSVDTQNSAKWTQPALAIATPKGAIDNSHAWCWRWQLEGRNRTGRRCVDRDWMLNQGNGMTCWAKSCTPHKESNGDCTGWKLFRRDFFTQRDAHSMQRTPTRRRSNLRKKVFRSTDMFMLSVQGLLQASRSTDMTDFESVEWCFPATRIFKDSVFASSWGRRKVLSSSGICNKYDMCSSDSVGQTRARIEPLCCLLSRRWQFGQGAFERCTTFYQRCSGV